MLGADAAGHKRGEDFLRDVRGRHRAAAKDFEQRNLRRYEKGVFKLFHARCWPSDRRLEADEFCAECHRVKVRRVPSSLGELLLAEADVERSVDMGQCFEVPLSESPQCLRSVQSIGSDAVYNVPFPMGQDDD